MQASELLKTLQPIWLNRATESLARATNIRADLRALLEEFFDLLVQSVDTGDSAFSIIGRIHSPRAISNREKAIYSPSSVRSPN